MRKIPIILIIIAGGVSTVFWGYFSAYITTNKTIGIWCLYGGVIFSLLSGFLYWQNEIWADEYNRQAAQSTDKKTDDIKSTHRVYLAEDKTPKKGGRKVKEEEIKPPQPQIKIDASNGSAVSVNQQGGFTGNVNIKELHIPKKLPRVLTNEQTTKLNQILSRSIKGPVEFEIIGQDNEIFDFTVQISKVLTSTGWDVTRTRTMTGWAGRLPDGIAVIVHDGKNPPLHANALWNALLAIGLPVQGIESTDVPENEARLFIGKQPQ